MTNIELGVINLHCSGFSPCSPHCGGFSSTGISLEGEWIVVVCLKSRVKTVFMTSSTTMGPALLCRLEHFDEVEKGLGQLCLE